MRSLISDSDMLSHAGCSEVLIDPLGWDVVAVGMGLAS